MTTITITASREGFTPLPGIVTDVLEALAADRYVTGACRGGDAVIGAWLHQHRPAAEHVIVVPANRSQVVNWWAGAMHANPAPVRVLLMPQGTSYADRNASLVQLGDEVAGFPAWPEDDPRSLRSGTWQAIRMARRAGKPVQWQCVLPPYSREGS